MSDSLTGHLLIASPALADPNFSRTVVLLLEHSADGALGIVLNRPTPVDACDAMPELENVIESGDPVHSGGPVQPEAAIALALYEAGAAPDDMLVVGDVGVLPSGYDPSLLIDGVRRVRVFLGYAGWGGGQLEAELAEEAWIVDRAREEDPLDPASRGLWPRVLERMGGRYRLVARMPDDPSMN